MKCIESVKRSTKLFQFSRKFDKREAQVAVVALVSVTGIVSPESR